MTQRLKLHGDELDVNTTVVGCAPADDGVFHVVLSATLFHPLESSRQMSA